MHRTSRTRQLLLAGLMMAAPLAAQETPYSDVSPEHWAYESIVAIAGTGILDLPYHGEEEE